MRETEEVKHLSEQVLELRSDNKPDMIAPNDDVHAPSPSKVSSAGSVECELEEEDSWVVVKKQKITIFVPPPSPPRGQNRSPGKDKTEPRIVNTSTGAKNIRHHDFTKDEHKEYSSAPLANDSALAAGIEIGSKAQEPICNPVAPPIRSQEPICNHVAPPNKWKPPSFVKAANNGNSVASVHRKPNDVPMRVMPIGALTVANQRVRALNLERKLERLGGLRTWLVSLGLDRFVEVLERKKVGKYQLVNLTMGMLKDMGTNAVGPRRKLIHAIDSLCRPPSYFRATLQ